MFVLEQPTQDNHTFCKPKPQNIHTIKYSVMNLHLHDVFAQLDVPSPSPLATPAKSQGIPAGGSGLGKLYIYLVFLLSFFLPCLRLILIHNMPLHYPLLPFVPHTNITSMQRSPLDPISSHTLPLFSQIHLHSSIYFSSYIQPIQLHFLHPAQASSSLTWLGLIQATIFIGRFEPLFQKEI